MFKQNKKDASQRKRDGLVSHILLQRGDIPDTQLAITWVDVAPYSTQKPHSHAPEQVYVIIKGKGRMSVGNEEQKVVEGDLIYISPNVIHSIKNLSNEMLTYISAATPSIDIKEIYDKGELRKSK